MMFLDLTEQPAAVGTTIKKWNLEEWKNKKGEIKRSWVRKMLLGFVLIIKEWILKKITTIIIIIIVIPNQKWNWHNFWHFVDIFKNKKRKREIKKKKSQDTTLRSRRRCKREPRICKQMEVIVGECKLDTAASTTKVNGFMLNMLICFTA